MYYCAGGMIDKIRLKIFPNASLFYEKLKSVTQSYRRKRVCFSVLPPKSSHRLQFYYLEYNSQFKPFLSIETNGHRFAHALGAPYPFDIGVKDPDSDNFIGGKFSVEQMSDYRSLVLRRLHEIVDRSKEIFECIEHSDSIESRFSYLEIAFDIWADERFVFSVENLLVEKFKRCFAPIDYKSIGNDDTLFSVSAYVRTKREKKVGYKLIKIKLYKKTDYLFRFEVTFAEDFFKKNKADSLFPRAFEILLNDANDLFLRFIETDSKAQFERNVLDSFLVISEHVFRGTNIKYLISTIAANNGLYKAHSEKQKKIYQLTKKLMKNGYVRKEGRSLYRLDRSLVEPIIKYSALCGPKKEDVYE